MGYRPAGYTTYGYFVKGDDGKYIEVATVKEAYELMEEYRKELSNEHE